MSLAPIQLGQVTTVIETADSKQLTLDVKTTLVRSYKGPYSVCKLGAVPRGALGVGEMLGWVVAKCELLPERGGIATLRMTWETATADSGQPLPADEISLEPFEVNPKVERNGFFSILSPEEIQNVKNAAQNFNDTQANNGENLTNGIADSTHLAKAQSLLAKYKRGIETFYLAGFTYSWSRYYYGIPTLDNGGYAQSPQGPLAGNFPSGIVFLRKADSLANSGVNGGVYKLTKTWLGGPMLGGVGYWDPDLYPES